MITISLIIGCLLTFLFLRKKREIKKDRGRKGILYYLYMNSLEFLLPFVVVTSLFLVFDLVISIVVVLDSATLHFLFLFEETLARVKSFFSIFKLNAIQALMVLLALYLLGFLRFTVEKSKKLFALFDKYQSFARHVYIVLVLLCSFTFFGTQLGGPINNLSLRIKTIRDGYADLYNDAREVISEEVAAQLYPKVYDSFPQPYQQALELPTKIEQETNSLRDYYNSVRNEFGVKDRNVEVLLDRGSLRVRSAFNLEVEVPDVTRKRTDYFAIPEQRQINYKKIEDAKKAISQYRNSRKSRAIKLLQIEGGKKVICQIPKVFTAEVKKALFQQIIRNYPILEPAVDVFFRTLDKQIETRVERTIDRVVNSAIQSPQNFDKTLTEQVSTIVGQKNVEISKADLERAHGASIKLKNDFVNIQKARANLFHSVAPKEVTCELNSNLSVRISWSSVPDAQSYRIYWSSNEKGPINRKKSEEIKGSSTERWLEAEEFPVYYCITAVRGNWESLPSKPHKVALMSDNGGAKCQICGAKSIGYCHMRKIYVCDRHNIFTAIDGGAWRCP